MEAPGPAPLAGIVGIAVGKVAMRVDEAGHDPLPGGVDDAERAGIAGRQPLRQAADALDAIALDEDRLVLLRWPAHAVDERAALDEKTLALAHGAPPLSFALLRQGLAAGLGQPHPARL